MPVEPLAHFRVLVCRVIVEDDVNGLARGNLGFDGIEEADKLLMSMPLTMA